MKDWSSTEFIKQTCRTYRNHVSGLIEANASISTQQEVTTKERPVKGPVWVSKFRCGAPEGEARNLLCRVVDFHAAETGTYQMPNVGPLEGHWTGVRSGVDKNELEPNISEAAKHEAMAKEANNDLVIFFIYGGSFYMNGPSVYRNTYAKLARATGGRTYCVRQRLAPQHPFPEVLLDVLHGYLSLLAPPPDAHHKAIPASSIVLAGDSSGACLALGLLQVLLTIRRQGWAKTVPFYGKNVELALPAGMTGISAVADLANGFPSWNTNAEHDWFPSSPPFLRRDFATCEVWPSAPPRNHIYCDAAMLCHPIVSPALAEDWAGCPPIWLASGQEMIVDGVKFLIQRAHSQGVSTTFFEYQLMPHSWPTIFPNAPQSKKLWHDWSAAIRNMFSGEKRPSRAVFVHADGLREETLKEDQLVPFTYRQARSMMIESAGKMDVFTGDPSNSASKL